MNRKYGRAYAIKATANKLATIIYMLAKKGEAFKNISEAEHKEQVRARSLKAAKRIIQKNELTIEEFGFQLTK